MSNNTTCRACGYTDSPTSFNPEFSSYLQARRLQKEVNYLHVEIDRLIKGLLAVVDHWYLDRTPQEVADKMKDLAVKTLKASYEYSKRVT